MKTVIGDVVAHLNRKNSQFCQICNVLYLTTCSVECYWHCSDDVVHYKSDKMVNFCGFGCATMSPVTVFMNVVFFTFITYRNRKVVGV